MRTYLVRVSRAWWHMGNVEVEAATEEEAIQKALDQADEIDLNEWGEVVDLGHLKDKSVEDVLINDILQEANLLDNIVGPREEEKE